MSTCASALKYDFRSKAVLVTGCCSGIGAAIAKLLAQFGASMTITGLNKDKLAKTAQVCYATSKKKPVMIAGNLKEVDMASKLVNATLIEYGKLDVLINTVGCIKPKIQLSDPRVLEDFDEMMKLNLRVPLELIHHSVQHLIDSKGCIVNISSISGLHPHRHLYSMSKAALNMLTQTAAQELSQHQVRVNAICSGRVMTDWHELSEQSLIDASPLKHCCQPGEIASMAAYLISNDAANITGQLIVSDGGQFLKPILQP